LLLADRALSGRGWYLLLGLATGSAVVVEYSNLLLAGVLAAYWLLKLAGEGLRPMLAGAFWWLIGSLIPLSFLAFYNTVNFGHPLTLSYAYAINYPWAGSFATTFNFPLLPGLRAMLWWGEGGGWCGGPPCVNQGLFLLSPVMLMALPGLVLYARRRPAWFLLTTGLFIAYLLLFSTHHTFHGFTADGPLPDAVPGLAGAAAAGSGPRLVAVGRAATHRSRWGRPGRLWSLLPCPSSTSSTTSAPPTTTRSIGRTCSSPWARPPTGFTWSRPSFRTRPTCHCYLPRP
jgi:hypothetical protein